MDHKKRHINPPEQKYQQQAAIPYRCNKQKQTADSKQGVKFAELCQARKQLKLVDGNSTLESSICCLSDNNDSLEEESQLMETRAPEIETISTAPHMMPMKQPLEESEREMLYMEIENLRKERDDAQKKISGMEQVISATSLSSDSVEGNNDACQMMTGISWDVFKAIYLFKYLYYQ
ncbi:hypothetical protein CHS0354_017699 [Potamilus streckersoni]|uniref:Uncharacterized protein n=1 Tax=Potamilus streckersoni TaxID=2493646 RepID=A0AAE0RU67_9BIVA|nr:hypothetical protein CHS0354_017699 [Potamilus streckersoni]